MARRNKLTIAVVGLGTIGQATQAVLAKRGHPVEGIDLRVAGMPRAPRRYYDYAFVCVPTPRSRNGLNTRSVERVVGDLERFGCGTIVVRSTLPLGWTRKHSDRALVYMPSFARDATAFADELGATRVVAGAVEPRWAHDVLTLWSGDSERFAVDPETAELAKLANNAFLVLSISFANVMRDIAERYHADWGRAAEILRADPRIGSMAYLRPGKVGGKCLPKDVLCLHEQSGRVRLLGEVIRQGLGAKTTLRHPGAGDT